MQSQENNEGTGEDVEAQRGRIGRGRELGRNRNSSESSSANYYFCTCINHRRAICDVSYAVYMQRKKMYVIGSLTMDSAGNQAKELRESEVLRHWLPYCLDLPIDS